MHFSAASVLLMLIILTDLPKNDTDCDGKAYILDRKYPDREKAWRQKSCYFLGLSFLFCFICIGFFTLIKTLKNLFSLTSIKF